ncbi:hypothetical protein SLE2022_264750 [Rubroshorea leprosula]
MYLKDKESPKMVANKAINGTLGILETCLKTKTVRQVVYTSSAFAIFASNKRNEVKMMGESFWSNVDFIRQFIPFGGSYLIPKTLTKRATLEFAVVNGLDLVTLIPSFVVGHFLCPKLPEFVSRALALVFGMYTPKSVCVLSFVPRCQSYCPWH